MYVRAELLLDHMNRRSDEDFARFRVALRNFRQEHVVLKYLERLSESVSESGDIDESTMAAVIHPSEEECQPRMEMVTPVNNRREVEQQSEDLSVQQQDQCESRLSVLPTFMFRAFSVLVLHFN